ncbi:hypothetical protein JOB18_041315 [Solea senegalensis]|uniref:Uncharacterized protein n=1 Tax=Solea senegalensis TaxID=28829 RepID=A0AAV6QLU1_SOLSE|nr:hypothetical protein JOB18_041315 [Solea senegalensis]
MGAFQWSCGLECYGEWVKPFDLLFTAVVQEILLFGEKLAGTVYVCVQTLCCYAVPKCFLVNSNDNPDVMLWKRSSDGKYRQLWDLCSVILMPAPLLLQPPSFGIATKLSTMR